MSETRSFVQKVKPIWVDATGIESSLQHTPAPYALTPYPLAGVANNTAQTAFDFTAAAHWGAGNDIIIYSTALTLFGTEWNTLWANGFRVLIQVLGGNYFLRENFPAYDPKSRPNYHTAFTDYVWDKTWRFETGLLVTTAQTYRVLIHNDTGQNLSVQLNMAGIPINL